MHALTTTNKDTDMTQFNRAADRVAKWLGEYRKSRQHSQECIHGFNAGHAEREAELTPADLEAILAERAALLKALKGLVELDCPIRGVDPFGPKVVEHWKEQEAQGHGYADLYLKALAAISQATGEGE